MRGRAAKGEESTGAPKLISQVEYARRRGVTKQAVSRAIAGGRITLVDGMVDPEQADREWAAKTDPTPRGGTNGHAKGPSYGAYSADRGRREKTLADLAEMELAEKRRALVDAAEAERRFYDRARRARNILRAVPARLGRLLAGITDPNECERRLKLEIDRVCTAIAEGEK